MEFHEKSDPSNVHDDTRDDDDDAPDFRLGGRQAGGCYVRVGGAWAVASPSVGGEERARGGGG